MTLKFPILEIIWHIRILTPTKKAEVKRQHFRITSLVLPMEVSFLATRKAIQDVN